MCVLVVHTYSINEPKQLGLLDIRIKADIFRLFGCVFGQMRRFPACLDFVRLFCVGFSKDDTKSLPGTDGPLGTMQRGHRFFTQMSG